MMMFDHMYNPAGNLYVPLQKNKPGKPPRFPCIRIEIKRLCFQLEMFK